MSVFSPTPRTLIRSLRELADGQDEARWARFVELYEPAIRDFIRVQDPDMSEADRDDLVQDTFVRMVPAIRNGVFDSSKGRFRNFLATVIRNLMVDRLRANAVRSSATAVAAAERLSGVESLAASELLDMKWRLARHHAAVERIFARSALSEQSRRVYAMMEIDGLSTGEIAARTGLAANAVRRIISRVRRMVAAVEAMYDA